MHSPVGCCVPHLDAAILTGCEDDGQLRVEGHRTDVVCVALKGVHTGLGLVVPHLRSTHTTANRQGAAHTL